MRTFSKHAAAAAAFAGLTALIAPVVMAADATGDDTGTLSAIIVTAERRAESIQAVPLSVTAISGETLAKFDIAEFRRLRAPGAQSVVRHRQHLRHHQRA